MKNSILTVLFACVVVCGCTDGTSNVKTSTTIASEEKPTEEQRKKGCGGACCSSEKKTAALVCNLTDEEFRKHKETVVASLRKQVLEKKELDNGYAFKFKGDAKTLKEVNAFVDAERQCCGFFTFDLSISDDQSEAWLSMTGPAGVKDFIATEIEM